MAGSNGKFSRLGKDYRGIEKDPIIDLIRTEVEYQLGSTEITTAFIDKLAYNSGISSSTLRAWFYGQTKRPQSLSTRFVLEALGVTVKYFRNDGSQVMFGHNSRPTRRK